MELAPGLHRVGNDLVAVHLVVDDTGITIIDAGLAGHLRGVKAELATLGRSIADVRGIVLTHGDGDHLGFAERLRADHDIPLFMNAGDGTRARGEESSRPDWSGFRLGPTMRFLGYAARMGGLRTRFITDFQPAEDEEVLPLPGSPRILALPGHSAGSVAVLVPSVRALFVGDALTTRNVLSGIRGSQPAPFTDDPTAAAAALARIEDLEVDWILPGHGAPWTGGVPALLAAYREAMGVVVGTLPS